MSQVCKPVQVEATGAYRLEFSNPHPTHTHGAGTAGFVHKCYLLDGHSVADLSTVQYLWC